MNTIIHDLELELTAYQWLIRRTDERARAKQAFYGAVTKTDFNYVRYRRIRYSADARIVALTKEAAVLTRRIEELKRQDAALDKSIAAL